MTESTRARRKARTRAAIVTAARDRFVAVGYGATTVRDVADAAGVAVGTVHAHFADKTALLFACFHDQIAGAVALGFDSLDTGAPLIEQLTHIGRVLFAAYARHPALSRVMFGASLFPEGRAPGDDGLLEPFLDAIAELYRAARARGELTRLPDDGRRAAQLFFSCYLTALVGGLAGAYVPDGHPRAADHWASALRRLLGGHLAGLGGPVAWLDDPAPPPTPDPAEDNP